MKTFSLNRDDTSKVLEIWSVIRENEGYFKMFNRDRYMEAMIDTLVVAMANYNESYSDLTPYIKKLARTILKTNEHSTPYDIFNQDGEISSVFSVLKDYQDIQGIDGITEIEDVFKDLYLYDKEAFMALKGLYVYDSKSDLKGIRVKDDTFKMQFNYLINRFGSPLTFKVLADFYTNLPKLCENKESKIKEIKLKESNFTYLEKLSDAPTVRTKDGKEWGIDKKTLTMSIDPDYTKWDTVWTSVCDILKVDMTPLLDYVYKQVYVTEGVNTNLIQWCGNRYKLTTPGGTSYIQNYDRDKYIKLVRTELLLNLLQNNINMVVALSDDNVYIKPTRAFKFDTIRVILYCGKVIDLPIEIYIKKRKDK